MIRTICLFLFLLCSGFLLMAQHQGARLSGEVTFVTSRNVYVKFEHTSPLQLGDSLRLEMDQRMCLRVTAKSSSSVVCERLNDYQPQKGDKILFVAPFIPQPKEVVELLPDRSLNQIIAEEEAAEDSVENEETSRPKEVIRGRITISNYQNITSVRENRNRFMTRFWLDANNIHHSRFSLQAELNYRQIVQGEFDRPKRYLNVYNLALIYRPAPGLSLTLGRKINPKVASLGAIDGLQVEKSIGAGYVGLILGSRPDMVTFQPNLNLLEYGGYLGFNSRHKHFYSQTTLGWIEQRNAGNIDRRYAYFQHSSTLFKRLSLFSSLELDMYQWVNGVASTKLRLPNLFVSATYRMGKKASLMVSYDSRKRILYYETFQTDIERLLNDDLARESIRSRLNLRPIKYLNIGLSVGQRFQNDQQNKSDNLHGSISYASLPLIGGRVSASYNLNRSNYLRSNILSTRYARDIVPETLDMQAYYRMADYVFVNSERIRRQHYYGVNLGVRLSKKWGLRLAAERADFNQEANYRVYVRLNKRFYRSN